MNIATTSSSASALLLITNANRPGGWTPSVPAKIVIPPKPEPVSSVPSQSRADAQSKIVGTLLAADETPAPEAAAAEPNKRPDWAIYFERLLDPNWQPETMTDEERDRSRQAYEMKKYAETALGARNAQQLTAQRGNFGSVEEAVQALSQASSWMTRGLTQINLVANRGEVTLEDFTKDHQPERAKMLYEMFRNPTAKFQNGVDIFRIGEAFMRNTMGIEGDNLVRGEDGRYSVKPFETEIAGHILSMDGWGRITTYPKPSA